MAAEIRTIRVDESGAKAEKIAATRTSTSNRSTISNNLGGDQRQVGHALTGSFVEPHGQTKPLDPALITKNASARTYYIIRFLVDRDRVAEAFRAYAYFRWVDDSLDAIGAQEARCLAFVERQRSLLVAGYQGKWPRDLAGEEHMLMDLIQSDHGPGSGLQSYIRHMMAVMEFDTGRRGRLISGAELEAYSRHLSIAVTDALHYFVGHSDAVPRHQARYLAVAAAHITHMLRDTFEDNVLGYYNIPREFLERRRIDPWDIESSAYREWVKSRVELAREYFAMGKVYLAQVKSRRCRIAGYAYIAQFKRVLDAIERDGFQLRHDYPECSGLKGGPRAVWSVLSQAW